MRQNFAACCIRWMYLTKVEPEDDLQIAFTFPQAGSSQFQSFISFAWWLMAGNSPAPWSRTPASSLKRLNVHLFFIANIYFQ